MRPALFVVLAMFSTACSRTVDKEDCQKMVDHMIDLLSKDRGQKLKTKVENDATASIEKTCVGKISKAQYDCVMSAKTFDDASSCDSK